MITSQQPKDHRLRDRLPITLCLLACVVIVAVTISSCSWLQEQGLTPTPEVKQPAPVEELVIAGDKLDVRVRITADPVKKAAISSTDLVSILIDGKVISNQGKLKAVTISRKGDRWKFGQYLLKGEVLRFKPTEKTNKLIYNKRHYRGDIRLIPTEKNSFYVHNHVDMENYVASVIACELYSHFKIETFRAQAIAARTFALYEKKTRGEYNDFDVWDSVRSQVYRGYKKETPKSREAALATKGMVLVYEGTGKQELFLTQFSSCNGGYVNPAWVLRKITNRIPPLEGGQRDEDGKSCPRYKWDPVEVSKLGIYNVLSLKYKNIRKLGSIKTIRVRQETSFGRPVWLSIIGPKGENVPLRAETLRLALLGSNIKKAKKLYSMNCKILDLGQSIRFYDGQGFGHGVGMSQWGAQGKAERGWTAEKILGFYYRDSKISKLY